MLAVLFLALSPILLAQKLLTPEATVDPELHPKRLQQLQWLPEVNYYSYTNKEEEFKVRDAAKLTTIQTLSLEQLTAMLPKESRKPGRFPTVRWHTPRTFSFAWEGTVWSYTQSADSLRQRAWYPTDADAYHYHDRYAMAYAHNGNLHVAAPGEKAKAITTDGGYDIRYGEAAYRYEFGITSGMFWSPDEKRLAFYRIDQRAVKDYPLVGYGDIPANHKPIKYPMNGDSTEYTTIGVYDLESGKTVYLQSGQPYDQYLTNITWSPDGVFIYVARLNRGQDTLQLQQYDARSGVFMKTLFTETHPKYIEPEHGPIFLKRDKDKFLWFSKRDGYNHLYLFNTDGVMLQQVTTGEWEVTEYLGTDTRETTVYFTCTGTSPLSRTVWGVSLRDGKLEGVAFDRGIHQAQLSPDASYLLDHHIQPDMPGKTVVLEMRKYSEHELLHLVSNPLADYNVATPELVVLEAKDGTKLYSRVIKPLDFDEKKKYPVIIYTYGGPHLQTINNNWMMNTSLFLLYLAQEGYVVFTLDNRGSANRGLEFEQAIFRQMGTIEVADQMTGVEYLLKQPWVDKDRIGVHGWSYGGFMTISMLLKEANQFKVGVAGGPVIDWRMYEVMYGERYMDRHQDNPDGFAASNLTNYVDKLEGKRLLIIHGLQDDVVLPQHSFNFVNAAIAKGQLVDFFPYPSHPHNVRGPQRAHLNKLIADYFKRHL